MKPRIFIGSSTEGMDIARAVHHDLYRDYEATFWTQGVFEPGMSNLEALVSQIGKSDFAILVLTPDDSTTSRNQRRKTPRDNLVFELGLFMGKLGRSRTICVVEDGGRIKLPSDFLGISVIHYPKEPQDVAKELFATCTEIRTHIDRQWKLASSAEAPASAAANHGIRWDCTQREFVEHLKHASKVHIIGITNEHLAGFLDRAFQERGGKPWSELDIVFIAKRLMPMYQKRNEKEEMAILRWEQGVAAIRDFYSSGDRKAEMLSVRYMDSIIPFIGQMYDDIHIRVSFVLPFQDLRDSCFINYQDLNPPCHYQRDQTIELTGDNEEPLPPCKLKSSGPIDCNSCAWQHFSCQTLSKTIREIGNYSTPLFAANVVGSCSGAAGNPRFLYETLIPQRGWRDYKANKQNQSKSLVKPVHLCTFILLYTGNTVLLQRRTSSNSSADLSDFSLLAKKVCDEDFLVEPLSDNHRKKCNPCRKGSWKAKTCRPVSLTS